MCFSAEVSYGSAVLLMATGAGTALGNKSKDRRMLVTIPFLFGVQQLAEGLIWQSMGSEAALSLRHSGALLFLIFAYVIWPLWIPWSFYFIEPLEKRKKWLKVNGLIGILVSALAIWFLLTIEVRVYVAGHSLVYAFPNFQRHWPANLEALLYLMATVLPFFLSSLRTIKKAGLLIVASMLIAKGVNEAAASSIWCLFAALISFYIAVNILWLQRGKIS